MDTEVEVDTADPPPPQPLEESKCRNGRELGKIVWITGAVHGFLGILSIPFLVRMEPAFQLNGDQMLGLPIFVTIVGFIATGLQLAGSGCATKTVRKYANKSIFRCKGCVIPTSCRRNLDKHVQQNYREISSAEYKQAPFRNGWH